VTIQYLLDENLSPHWRKRLLRREPGMILRRIGDPGVPPLQSADPLILDWCQRHGFSLVTKNRQTMAIHLAEHLAMGKHVPGIFMLTGSMTTDQLLAELVLIAGASLENEWQDQIWYLPIT